jgi:2-methylcitrate dehydratase PrpD
MTESPGSSSSNAPITSALATLGAGFRFADLPPDVVLLAKQCFLDWLGCALAGSREPLAAILQDEVREQGGHAQATILGTAERASLQQAALVNGAASHALDYDDVQWEMSGHPSVPVFPGLLALAESRRASGRDFLTAFVAGFETECRVGLLVNPGHYAAGWHATGTLGTFGSAAACAWLLSLDEERWRHALGIAAAQAAGLKSMFGTMCKPLHAGKAAANGLLAATLAARGFTSNLEALETAQGFAATQTTTFQPERCLAGAPSGFALRSVLFKYHAACFGTHSSIEGVLRLKEDHHLSPDQVRAIHLRVPVGALSMCNIQEPHTALEGKFSLRFTAALALGWNDTGETAFTDARVHDPALVALRDRVTVEGDASVTGGTNVTVELADGRELREQVDVNTPATDLDRQWQRLVAKFRGLAAPVVGTQQTEALIATVAHLEEVADMASVARAGAPAFAGAVR